MNNFQQLPLTSKDDLAKYVQDFYAVKTDKVADIVLSSGTTGTPIKIIYTAQDLKRLAYNEEKSFRACAMTKEDIVLLTCTIDRCFVAGLAYYSGAQAVGAATIRNGLNSLESHFDIIKNMHPTVIVGVPSFLRKLGAYCHEKNLRVQFVNKLICIGEPLRNERMDFLQSGKDLIALWPQAKVYSTYSSSEIITSFCDCTQKRGGHLHPELAIVEIVDDNGHVVPCGTHGEVVVTPLMIEGMPLVRFKTGDISFLIDGDCGCGRKSLRLGPILGRKQQMMKVKGTTIYPQAVFSALDEIKIVREYYVEATSSDALEDNLIIYISLAQDANVQVVKEAIQAKLRVTPQIVVENESVLRERIHNPATRKPVRFFDRRIK